MSALRPKRIMFEDQWPQLEHSINCMLQHKDIQTISFMDSYSSVYDLCNAFPKPHIRALLVSICELVDKYCSTVYQELLTCQQPAVLYSRRWIDFQESSKWLNFICRYLNRLMMSGDLHFVKQHLDASYQKTSVEALAFSSWKNAVLLPLQHSGGNRLMLHIFDCIKQDRIGDYPLPDELCNSLKATVESLVAVNQYLSDQSAELYLEMFEEQHLKSTRTFYAEQSSLQLADTCISYFTGKVQSWLDAERLRCVRICNPISVDRIMRCCEQELISTHISVYIREFDNALSDGRMDDLSRCYRLLRMVTGGPAQVAGGFEEHIYAQGRRSLHSIGENNGGSPLMQCLINLHTCFHSIVADRLNSDVPLATAMDKAFRRLVNSSANVNFAELLAKSADSLLRRPANLQRFTGEPDVLNRLDELLRIFKYVDSKDSFQKHYIRRLAQRLIHGTSLSIDAEGLMINKLRDACGADFASRLQKMFTDIGISEDLSTRFRNQQRSASDLHASFLVLTSGCWPFSQLTTSTTALTFIPPASIAKCMDKFVEFYSAEYNGRRLHWMHHLSRVEMRLYGFDKRYDLSLAVHQAALLDCLNADGFQPITSVESLARAVQMEAGEVKSCLQPLFDLQILIIESDEITVNGNFSSKRIKIRVPAGLAQQQPQQGSEQESAEVEKSIQDDRRYFLQAAIVRVMKAKRELTHVHLVQEVIELSRAHFVPQVSAIKKCIEQLLDKQFINRLSDSSYQYIA